MPPFEIIGASASESLAAGTGNCAVVGIQLCWWLIRPQRDVYTAGGGGQSFIGFGSLVAVQATGHDYHFLYRECIDNGFLIEQAFVGECPPSPSVSKRLIDAMIDIQPLI